MIFYIWGGTMSDRKFTHVVAMEMSVVEFSVGIAEVLKYVKWN